jgi:hypothetical protein
MQHIIGAKRRVEAPCRGSSDPIIEAGAPSTGELQESVARVCARPTGDRHGLTTQVPRNASRAKSEDRANVEEKRKETARPRAL